VTPDTRHSTPDDAALWAGFLAHRDAESREALILRYVPLVHYVLNRFGLPAASGPDYEDLVSQGLLGLIDAIDRFDPAHGAQFSTYATLRVRGRILDALRAQDWLSRSARRRARQVQTALNELWATLHRAPSDEELAQRLKLDVDELRQSLVDAGRVLISLDATESDDPEDGRLYERLADDRQPNPDEAADEHDLQRQLAAQLRDLPEREQLVLSLYYHEELTLKEIGAVLDLSESRVCQLHARAVLSLRAALSNADPAAQPSAPGRRHSIPADRRDLSNRVGLVEVLP
jgi:RNA polymerase sigma factor for flagellar operon FliA